VQQSYTIGPRTFVLDRAKAEAALAAKRVVGGRETMTFNLLPLKYGWAYDLYQSMEANHWEPEDVPMQRDVQQWRSDSALSEIDRWIVRMGIGYFSAAEGIVGDNVIHVVRELVTASESSLP
jgi:ribonucleoside-diphosphate reductase beta chain